MNRDFFSGEKWSERTVFYAKLGKLKNAFHRRVQKFIYPQNGTPKYLFNIALQPGKTIPTCEFLSNAIKRQKRLSVPSFPLIWVQVPLQRKYATFSVINFSKQLTLLALPGGNRGADRRGMKSLEFRRLYPDGMAIPYFR